MNSLKILFVFFAVCCEVYGDVDECATNNGGCEQRCVNYPGGYHCECSPPLSLASDGQKCERRMAIGIPEPFPLSSAPCDTVTCLLWNVKHLSEQLYATQAILKRIMESPFLKDEQGPCSTPNGARGECKSIFDCQPLLSIVIKSDRTQQDLEFLKKSQCGFGGTATGVCCPHQTNSQVQPTRQTSQPTPSNQCLTPGGQPGQCISLYYCPDIENLLKPPVPDEKIQYVTQSKCNGPDQYSVCCGPVPSFEETPKGQCALNAFPADPSTDCGGVDSTVDSRVVEQGPCSTPNGASGECKSIYDCQPLLSIVNKFDRTQQDLEFLKKSQCGYGETGPDVCCPHQTNSQVQPTRQASQPTPSNQCYTPGGQPGQCISLYSCPDIANLLKPPAPNEKIQYVMQSKCNGPDKYSVCCGPVPSFEETPKGQCALTAFPPDPSTECCGVDSRVGNKIVGGEATTIDQYPWMALVEYAQDNIFKMLCAGALISGKYVLTAGHCVAGQVLSVGTPKNIRLGEYDTTHEGPDCTVVEAGGQDCTYGITRIPIEKVIPHPQFDPDSARKRHDIGLIRMAQLAPFTDFIRPLCLPTVDMTQRTDSFNLTIAGWGAVNTRQTSSPIKLQVELPYVSLSQCQPAYSVSGRKVALWKRQFCAGGLKGKDSCKGDSGGPLIYENGKTYEVIGVVSFGPVPCGLENVPGVYTNVYEYNSWIRNTITP